MKRYGCRFFEVICISLLFFCFFTLLATAGVIQVDYPGAQQTMLPRINKNGVAVGVYILPEEDDGSYLFKHVFTYDLNKPEGSRFTTIDMDLSVIYPGHEAPAGIIVTGISNDGTIVGFCLGYSFDEYPKSFVYKDGALSVFEYPGARDTFLSDINSSGVMCGLYKDEGGNATGFLYDPSKPDGQRFTLIDHPGTTREAVTGMNDTGLVVGNYNEGTGWKGYIYDIATGTFTDLDIPGYEDRNIYPLDISDSGAVYGHMDGPNGGISIFFYDPARPEGDRFVVVEEPLDPFTIMDNEDVKEIVDNNIDGYLADMFQDGNGLTHGFVYIPDSSSCDEEDSGAVDIVGVEAACGEETRVPIRIQNAYKPVAAADDANGNAITAFGFDVTYDPDVLSFVDFERGPLLLGFDDVVYVIDVDHNQVATGVVRVGGFTTENGIAADQEGILGYLIFSPVQPVTSTYVGISDMVDDLQDWSATGACLTTPTGDINLDGDVTPRDALCAFEEAIERCDTACGSCDTVACDVTKDCQCSASDALCIFRRYLEFPSCLD